MFTKRTVQINVYWRDCSLHTEEAVQLMFIRETMQVNVYYELFNLMGTKGTVQINAY